MAPAGAPRTIVDQLAAQIGKLVADPRKRANSRDRLELSPTTPEGFREFKSSEIVRWALSSRSAGMKAIKISKRTPPGLRNTGTPSDNDTCADRGRGAGRLTLAIDLAWRGDRRDGRRATPRRRTARAEMQSCRGPHHGNLPAAWASQRRCATSGLPADYPHDIAYRTTFTGQELTRIPIPCRRDRFTRQDGPDCNWPTPEPPHRVNQIFLEPILFEHAAAQPSHLASSTARRSKASRRSRIGRCATVARSRYRGRQAVAAVISSAATGRDRRSARRSAPNLRATPSSSACSRPYSRARPDRSSAARARVGHRRHQPAPRRQWSCDRRPRALDDLQLLQTGRGRFRCGRSRLGDPHHPRRRAGISLRDPLAGRIGTAAG